MPLLVIVCKISHLECLKILPVSSVDFVNKKTTSCFHHPLYMMADVCFHQISL